MDLSMDSVDSLIAWDPFYYVAIGIVVSFFLFAGLFTVINRKGISLMHVLAFGLVAILVAVIVQNYLALVDWIYIGIMGYDLGASLFVFGMISTLFVMGYNLITTSGKTMVQ